MTYKAKDFIDAIPGSAGIISTIARRVGCVWNTADDWCRNKPTVAKAYRDECERVIDMAEGVVLAGIKDGDLPSAKWYLARKGKKRGYADKLEMEQSGKVEVVVTWAEHAND